jgi:cytochrome b
MIPSQTKAVLIWDLPTRLFHWTLSLLIFAQFATGLIGESWLNLHAYLGYMTLALLIFRIIWGLIGGYWSKFMTFFPKSRAIQSNLQIPNAQPEIHAGHTFLGSLSIVVMICALFLQVVSGLMSDDEISFSGPLASMVSNHLVELMTWYHTEVGYYLIAVLVGTHILAIIYYQFKGIGLTSSMINGYKILEAHVRASDDNLRQRLLALIIFIACLLLVFLVLLNV